MFRGALSLLSTRTLNTIMPNAIRNEFGVNIARNLIPSAKFSSFNQEKICVKLPKPFTSPLSCMENDFLRPKLPPQDQVRTVTKSSWKTGKKKTVKAVIHRFYRLNCGNWIRTMAGRFKKNWKKTAKRRCKLKQHVFCNAKQCTMLDKMVTKYWRKPKYYIKNPYEPYEWRENFYLTRRKPWRPEGVDYE